MSLAAVTKRVVFPTGEKIRVADMSSERMRKGLLNKDLHWKVRELYEAELALRQNRADAEFRQEVLDALLSEGKAPHVADSLIDTEAKLLAQAKRVGVL